MRESRLPWIASARFDSVFILLPAFLVSLLVVGAPDFFRDANQETPLWGWVVFVLCIDVAHVYGTLYRTYFHSQAREDHRSALWIIPLFAWLAGIVLYSTGSLHFWRVIAYVAVFHFVRQQYGFVRIYSRHETLTASERRIFGATIYIATLYPLIYWHTHLPRNFSWFVDGDFFDLAGTFAPRTLEMIELTARAIYFGAIGAYIFAELGRVRSGHGLNWPRVGIVSGTLLSWYLGIVVYNGDLAFTATNVVAHGIPYMALTWTYWRKRDPGEARRSLGLSALIFVASILAFAYAEEWLWEIFVSGDHAAVFPAAGLRFELSDATLTWLVPLLVLPQLTHYVLDGFIWKMKAKGSEWKSMLVP